MYMFWILCESTCIPAVNISTKTARLCSEVQAATASGTDSNSSSSFFINTPSGLHPTPLTPFSFLKGLENEVLITKDHTELSIKLWYTF